MALHFNCPFCGHKESFDESPAGGFTVCPSCSETLPESYQAGEAGPPVSLEEGSTGEQAEFLDQPTTPESMPTIAGGEESLPHVHEQKSYVWLWVLLLIVIVLILAAWFFLRKPSEEATEATSGNQTRFMVIAGPETIDTSRIREQFSTDC